MPHARLKSYIIGFVLSLVLTLEAYQLVVSHAFSNSTVVIIILAMAIVQLFVQLFFFLHLDRVRKAPWNIILFLFMALVVCIVVFGSLWIMKNLNYHMLSPAETNQYLEQHEGL